jgi:hypothetical protein
MAKAEATVEELVMMIERGELRLPEMQRRYVWRSTRVRDLLDSIYRGYPSGAILLWETDEDVPLQKFAVEQVGNPYQSVRLLLDGQQRLTSLSAVILCPRALKENINKAHGGPSLSGAGRHDQQCAPLSGFKSFGHAPDCFVLVGAFANLLIDGRIFERGLVLVYELQAEQVVVCEKSCNCARMGEPNFPKKMM